MAIGSDRSVVVQIEARGGAAAAGELNNVANASRGLSSTIAENEDAARDLAEPLALVGAAATAGFIGAVKTFADFDEQMSSVRSLSHATSDEMAELSQAAMDSGTAFGFTASEAADAEIELVKAGVSVKDIMGGALPGALTLAAAGQIDVAEATEIAASTMTQFGLAGQDVTHIADLLAAGADKALGSVADLGEGLKYIGPVAKANNVSLEQTVGTLSLFAQNGIKGEQAGTGLRGMLLSLTAPSDIAKKKMDELGISVYDGQGKFIGFNGVAQQLQDKLGGVDLATRNAALGIIFGNAQVTSATVLMQGGSKAVDQWTDAVNEQGFAADQAAGKTDNLNGDMTKLASTLQNTLIKSGGAANGMLRELTQGATGLVAGFNNAPPVLQGTALGITGVVGATGLAAAGVLTFIPKVHELKAAMSTLGITTRGAIGIIGGFAVGIGAAALAVSTFSNYQQRLESGADAVAETLDKETGKLTQGTRAWVVHQLAQADAYKAAKNAGVSQRELTDAVLEGGDALDKVRGKLAERNQLTTFFSGEGIAAGNAKDKILELNESIDRGKGSWKDQEEALAGTTEATGPAAEGLQDVGEAADESAEEVGKLGDKIRAFGEEAFSVDGATRALEQAVDDFTDGLKEAKPALDDTKSGFNLAEQSGRDAQSAIEDIAKSTLDLSAATYEQTQSQEAASKVIADGRQKFLDAAKAAGIGADAANDYADRLGLIPDDVKTTIVNNAPQSSAEITDLKNNILSIPAGKTVQITAQTAAAQGQLDAFIRQNDGRVISVRQVLVQQAVSAGASRGIAGAAYAAGGPIFGPGTGTSDDVPILASNGEHMWTTREVAAAGGHDAVRRIRQAVLEGAFAGIPGYATGGAIGQRPDMRYSKSIAPIIIQTTGGGDSGPHIENLTVGVPAGAEPRTYADEIVWTIRTMERGGR